MRILHVITSLHIGGAERLMTILLPRLRDLGNEVELLVFDGTRTAFTDVLERRGIKIHSLKSKNVYSPANILKLRTFIGRYDIIHTHNTACQLFVPIAKMLFLQKKTLLFTTEHSTSNRRRSKKWMKLLDKWMYRQYEKVVCIGESTEINLLKYLGNRIVKTCVIHNGIELPGNITDLNLDDSDVIISMVAAFRPGKDQDCLVKAMTLLPEGFKLRFIGDGERRKEVEQLTVSLGLSERVEFTGNRSDVNELLQNSHINVLSSHWEGLSLSSLECMASGRPFIASDVAGLHEIVEGAGLLFPDDDYKTLAKQIKSLIDDKKLYEDISSKCRKRAEEYDIAKTAELYNKVYSKVR